VTKRISSLCAIALTAAILSVVDSTNAATESTFGAMPDGRIVKEYLLRNSRGSEASVIALGAAVRSLSVQDRVGRNTDVVLGYDTLKEYLDGRAYFGATIGRYANRIANAQFSLEGRTYRLIANNGAHSLHGGKDGFNRAIWSADEVSQSSVRLKYVSPDGEEGYPGELTIWVTYALTDANELRIEYKATSSATTIVNFTNHSYFNLGGAGEGDVLRQRLHVAADSYTPLTADQIPTGQIAAVDGTDYDLRKPEEVGLHLKNAQGPTVTAAKGFDVNLVIRGRSNQLRHAATLQDPDTGIELRLLTTEPGLQLFTPNFSGRMVGKGGKQYAGAAAVCLETQHFPDSPHHPAFPNTVLEAGETFRSVTIYRFSISQ
jgi:aldose 1-epimerase